MKKNIKKNMYKENTFIKNKSEEEKEESQSKYAENLGILDRIIEKRNFSGFNLIRGRQIKADKKIKEISRSEECLKRLLAIYGLNDLEFKKIGKGLFEIKINIAKDYEKMDNQYAYKGGAARSILEKELGYTNKVDSRDVDLLRTADRDENEEDIRMAMKYSADDLENGYGIEQLKEDYFETRDFTINELLVVDDRIILSIDCLLDTARGIIRFSDYEKKGLFKHRIEPGSEIESRKDGEISTYLEKYKDEKNSNKRRFFVNDKLMAKALRFSVIQSTRRSLKVADEEVYEYLDINNFHIALHLDRALEDGFAAGRDYMRKMIELGQLDSDFGDNPDEALKKFIEMMQEDEGFIFRAEILAVINNENESEELNELARRAQSTKNIKNIEEYL